MKNNNLFLLLIIIVGCLILFLYIRNKLKLFNLPNVVLVTGAPKTFKSGLSLTLARRTYRKNVFKWYVGKLIWYLRYHNLKDYPIKPMFYSNVPVAFMHNKLTKDILLRKVKVPKKSVIFIDEASLVADSMNFKDDEVNYQLLMFFKLIGHSTYGGSIFMNTHTVSDLHYAIKRTIGRYYYIYQSNKYPLITLVKVREMVFSDDNNIVNDINEDFELSVRTAICFNGILKKYDCFCYSTFTDNLMYQVDYDYVYDKKDLKAKHIVSFNKRINDMEVNNDA